MDNKANAANTTECNLHTLQMVQGQMVQAMWRYGIKVEAFRPSREVLLWVSNAKKNSFAEKGGGV